jgi:type VI secretion system secreted protein VgrG
MADLKNFVSLIQASIGQENRLIKLTTILGENVLLPQRVVGHERLGRSYEYTVDCISVRQTFG